jgi:predicted GNAT family acetyltransferase
MSNQYRLQETNVRAVIPGDERALDTYLIRHWATTMFIRSNLRIGGLVDQGHPTQGTYVAAWDEGGAIEALAVHYRTGALIVHAPRHLGAVVHEAAALSGRLVTAIAGPWPQVEMAANASGVAERARLVGSPQTLMTIALKNVGVAEAAIRENIHGRLATKADLEIILPWRMARDLETHGLPDTQARRRVVHADMEEQIRVQGLYVAQTRQLVAMCSYDTWARDGVQIGGIWVPQIFREKGYGAVVVAEAATAALSYGVPRATLLVEKSHNSTMASMRALGFAAFGDYGMLSYPGLAV